MFTPSSPIEATNSLLLINRDDACPTSFSDAGDIMLTSSSKTVKLPAKYSTTTEHNPHEANCCIGRGNGKPKNGYHRSNKHYLKANSAGPVRPWT
jgi:hypothetical protein